MRVIAQLAALCLLLTTAHAERITALQVSGNERIETATILATADLKKGDDATPSRLDDVLRDLYATGYFADVKLRIHQGAVSIAVVEEPMVNQISFEGNDEIEAKILTEIIALKPRKVYSISKLKADTKVMQDLYRLKGYFAAKVTPQIIRRDYNRVDVVFAITEGQATKVGKIIFVGNKSYAHATLEEAIQTKESRWFRFLTSDDTYDPERVELDKEKLRRFYMEKGYVDFRLKSAVAELTPDQKEFFITFAIDEGKRHKFGDVVVKSQLAGVEAASLESLVVPKKGDWYSMKAIEKTADLLVTFLAERGFAFVDVKREVVKADAAETLNAAFILVEGPHIYVDKIIVKGNNKTDDDVIRRELLLYEGDAYNDHKVKMSERRLRNLGFFKTASIKKRPTARSDKVDLLVEVAEEESTGSLWISGGASTQEGLMGSVGASENNLMGRGQSASLTCTLSKKSHAFSVGFTEPAFLDRRVAASMNLHHEKRKREYNNSFSKASTGARMSLGYHFSEDLRHRVYYGLTYSVLGDIGPKQSEYLKQDEGSAWKSVIGHTLTYDARDNRFATTRGHFITITNELAGLGGAVKYHKHDATAGKFFEIADDVVLSLMGHVGMIRGMGGRRVSIGDRYTFGGDGSLRGFTTSGIAVRDARIASGKKGAHKGDDLEASKDTLGVMQYYLGTVEASFPVGLPNELGIKGVVFTDVGAGWGAEKTETEILSSSEPRVSVGLGFIWNGPFGPLRVDYARAIKKQSYDTTQSIHFGFTTRF